MSNAYGYNDGAINISGGQVVGADAYNTSTTNISGGSVIAPFSRDMGTTNISGGSVTYATAYDMGTLNISGGDVSYAIGFDSSITNISGGNVTNAFGSDTNLTNVSGGILINGLFLEQSTANANFIGMNLSYAYTGYGTGNPYNALADSFLVSGFIGGKQRLYNLYLSNDSGTGNSTVRQLLFNGAAQVVPEAGSLTLLLPALGVLTIALHRRKK